MNKNFILLSTLVLVSESVIAHGLPEQTPDETILIEGYRANNLGQTISVSEERSVILKLK